MRAVGQAVLEMAREDYEPHSYLLGSAQRWLWLLCYWIGNEKAMSKRCVSPTAHPSKWEDASVDSSNLWSSLFLELLQSKQDDPWKDAVD